MNTNACFSTVDQPRRDAIFFPACLDAMRNWRGNLARGQGGWKKPIHLATNVVQSCLLVDLDAITRFACVQN